MPTVSNRRANVNEPIMMEPITITLPTPRGQQVGFEQLPPHGISPKLFENLPHHAYSEWLPGGEGVRSREKLPVQIKRHGHITIEKQHIIILRNGRLCLDEDIHYQYQHITTVRVGMGEHWVACYADKKKKPKHEIQISNQIAFALWEYIFQADNDLYMLFEMLGDGIQLDPLTKRALFQSEASARVFRRQYPDYFCHYHTPLLYEALRDGMEIDEVFCRATFRSQASAEAFRRVHFHWEVGYVQVVPRAAFPEDISLSPFAQISPREVA